MKIYISGISGTGMGPLALMARDAGFEVCGSDVAKGPVYDELVKAGIEVYIGKQDGSFLRQKNAAGKVDWFVHTSALPPGHREMAIAKLGGLRITKRDELTKVLVEKLGLKMVAVAGTHGKTTTAAMIVWTCLKLGLPVSYVVGTTLGFAASGAYHAGDRYFIYEADEYDRNFLKFRPWLSVITSVSYDHPDIYKTREEYEQAFEEFRKQSERVIERPTMMGAFDFKLAGEARRWDAKLAGTAVLEIESDYVHNNVRRRGGAVLYDPDYAGIVEILNEFPGVGRRFERLCAGVYSDYAHHPEEIAATLDVAMDECSVRKLKGVVAVYQPHQNARQYEVREGYARAFSGFESGSDFGSSSGSGSDFDGLKKVYWLPTYLVREDPELAVLAPSELSAGVPNAVTAEMNDELFLELMRWRDEGYLVLLMTAGTGDGWLRGLLKTKNMLK